MALSSWCMPITACQTSAHEGSIGGKFIGLSASLSLILACEKAGTNVPRQAARTPQQHRQESCWQCNAERRYCNLSLLFDTVLIPGCAGAQGRMCQRARAAPTSEWPTQTLLLRRLRRL